MRVGYVYLAQMFWLRERIAFYSHTRTPLPCGAMVKTRFEVAMLQSLAEVAAAAASNELGIEAECLYLGQVAGPGANRSYIREPSEWILGEGAWPSRQTIAYEWRWGGDTDAVEQRCDKAHRNVQARRFVD